MTEAIEINCENCAHYFDCKPDCIGWNRFEAHPNINSLIQAREEKLSVGRKSVLDTQIGGDHYKQMKIQPVVFITENNIPYLEGNVIKYVCRHASKNGVEDINKAIQYLEMIKETQYGAQTSST